MTEPTSTTPRFVVQRNAAEAADVPPTPPHPAGRLWRFEMIFGGGAWRAYADTAADLVAALIPGYDDLVAPTERAHARLRTACDLQVRLQAALVAGPQIVECTAEQREVLLGNFSQPPVLVWWDAPVPLVLVKTFYAPYRPTPAPEGNVWWLDPSDEWELLVTLAQADVIRLHARDDLMPPMPAPGPDQDGDDGRR